MRKTKKDEKPSEDNSKPCGSDPKDLPLKWHSPKAAPFHLAGLAWFATDGAYRRLPLKPARPIPPNVDYLANSTAGAQIRFQTNSTRLSLRVKLPSLADMNHMPATGQCGFDCYIGPPGAQCYFRTTTYDQRQVSYESMLLGPAPAEMRNFTVNFPLYKGVEEVSVGLDEGAEILPPPPYDSDLRVVAYGTSITQGGCACRPGMAYTNILSRRFNMEFINLGFSGNGRGEPEVAATIAEIERPGCFILDYEANSGSTDELKRTFPEFIRILRDAHPKVPILALSRTNFSSDLFDPAGLQSRIERRDFQRSVIDGLRKKGDKFVYFKDGSELLGKDFDECTVDGAHPTDLGFMRMADALTPVLRAILPAQSYKVPL